MRKDQACITCPGTVLASTAKPVEQERPAAAGHEGSPKPTRRAPTVLRQLVSPGDPLYSPRQRLLRAVTPHGKELPRECFPISPASCRDGFLPRPTSGFGYAGDPAGPNFP